MIDSPALLDVAAALADGTPVDWDSAAQSATSDEDRRLLAGTALHRAHRATLRRSLIQFAA